MNSDSVYAVNKTNTIPLDPIALEKWAHPAQQARSRATRERILAAAEAVFAAQGYEKARISDIARAAGCSAGAIYFRFHDKEALFLAIAESFIGQTRRGLREFLATPQDYSASDTIRSFVTRTAGNFRQHRGLFRAIVERGFDHPQVMDAMMTFREDVIGSLDSALQPKGPKSVAISSCVRVIAQMVFGFLLTGVLNPRSPTRIDDEKSVSGLADAAIAYFGTVAI
jgi:AcrR family transcriptional regulator